MRNIQIPKFLCFASFLVLYSSMLSAQVIGIKLIEENKERKYALVKTDASDNYATILRDIQKKIGTLMSEQNLFSKREIKAQPLSVQTGMRY